MVDFQSRDTDRGYGADEDEEEPADEAADAEADTETPTGDDEAPSRDSPDAGEAADADGPATERGASAGDDTPEEAAGGAEASDTDSVSPDEDSDPLGRSTEQKADASEAGGVAKAQPGTATESADSIAGEVDHGDADASEPGEAHAETDEPAHAETHGSDRERGQPQGHVDAHDQGPGHDHSHDHSHDHEHGADVGLLGVAVVTVSSTRTREDDASGDVIQAVVEAADHEVVTREILRDDLDGVQTTLLALTGRDDVDVVVTTGGTGVTPDDVTVEAARPLFDRELPGFGELFRLLSYEDIGTRAMVSRATAGMVDGVPVFCLPGSEAAAHLGTEELVVEEMAHLVSLARRDD